ncbi:hypothetical protein [Colwellia sp. 75C3]|uniref:hypothetical protein n=1 Tax=Colwellia sp. 75C3 TaxID=888425 RepID=UPI0018E2DEF0|nr:hypothetical protein [Colwellia sp. 75C3]
MQTNEILQSAINSKNINAAQAVILASFRKTRNDHIYPFIEWANYANTEFNKNGLTFFIDDDGTTEFTDNSDNWNVDLWKSLRVELEYNFSEIKLAYIIKVMKHLRQMGDPDFQEKTSSPQAAPIKENSGHPKQGTNLKQNHLKIGVIAGAALGAVLGAVVGRPIIGGLVGAAIGGGLGQSVNGSKDK